MASRVYVTNMRTKSGLSLVDKVGLLFDAAGFAQLFGKDDLVAIKLHVGEPGNIAFIPPPLVRRVVDKIKAAGARPFLTDSNTLYVGRRSNAVDHTISALENGFTYATVGAPFIVADGLTGHEHVKVPIDGVRLKEVRIGAAIAQADAMIALSHFKGHEATGFGGAIKNVGMGSASRGGKQEQHSNLKPAVRLEKCTGCGRCVRWCPAGALSVGDDRRAHIDPERCIGCAECTITCNNRAIKVQWEEGEEGSLQEKMAEYALGVVKTKAGKCGFMNFVMNVSPQCDCYAWNDVPIVPSVGILASCDPVAVDAASVDLVNRATVLPGSAVDRSDEAGPHADKFAALYPDVDWTVQLRHGERIGLGTRDYALVHVAMV
ncbi:MAG: DUF362 domain-containing protein [Firmicutes bacterium]|nr:DUF362 domain-containing protein [Bacillota bacterium]MDH7494509.1 DUF362 domain-containing protein [Bacillota bacterium]